MAPDPCHGSVSWSCAIDLSIGLLGKRKRQPYDCNFEGSHQKGKWEFWTRQILFVWMVQWFVRVYVINPKIKHGDCILMLAPFFCTSNTVYIIYNIIYMVHPTLVLIPWCSLPYDFFKGIPWPPPRRWLWRCWTSSCSSGWCLEDLCCALVSLKWFAWSILRCSFYWSFPKAKDFSSMESNDNQPYPNKDKTQVCDDVYNRHHWFFGVQNWKANDNKTLVVFLMGFQPTPPKVTHPKTVVIRDLLSTNNHIYWVLSIRLLKGSPSK